MKTMFRWHLVILLVEFVRPNLSAEQWKTCSTQPFCNKLRNINLSSDEKYTAKGYNVTTRELLVHLKNAQEKLLQVNISVLEQGRFRVKIEEPNSQRIKLRYSLNKEPTSEILQVVSADENHITIQDVNQHKIIVQFSPFNIQFYHNSGVLQSEIDGDKLFMEYNNMSQAFAVGIKFFEASALFGLHERSSDSLKLTQTFGTTIEPYRLKNVDMAGDGTYVVNTTKAMYGNIPLIYGISKNHSSGVFIHNAAEMFVDIDQKSSSAYIMGDGGTLDIFILIGPTLAEAIQQYATLTGLPHLPQLWALGYHQSRWAYNSTTDVKNVINAFDAYDHPLDVLWFDIEWTQDREFFTWNLKNYPDPVAMFDWVNSTGRKIVGLSDPHFKVDTNYWIYNDGIKNKFYVRNKDDSPYVGTGWPGKSIWFDYYNPATRDYYSKLYLYENFKNTTPTLAGIWNDMNEPASFDKDLELTISMDTWQNDNGTLIPHRYIHNIYGLTHVMTTHDGLLKRDKGRKRPFILSRSHFPGSQRYAAKWSGDNWCVFEDLRVSVTMALYSALCGASFYGADIPGFNGAPTDELAIRWYQAAIWLPFFRSHANLGTKRREPYTFKNETQVHLRKSLRMRYAHLPVWYTLMFQHVRTAAPVIRPLLYHYVEDDNVLLISDHILLGQDILVRPVYTSNTESVNVYFPGQDQYWFQIDGPQAVFKGAGWLNVSAEIANSPLFYRAGSIIARKDIPRKSSVYMIDDPYTLHIVLGQDNFASGQTYIDDFESFDYSEKWQYYMLDFTYDATTNQFLWWEDFNFGDSSQFQFKLGEILIYSLPKSGETEYQVTRFNHTCNKRSFSDIDFKNENSVYLIC